MRCWLIALSLGTLFAFSLADDAFDIRYNCGSDTMYYPQGPDSTGYTPPPSGCKLAQIVLLSRHGARYPTKGVINNLSSLQNKLNAHTFNSKYSWMTQWKNPYSLSKQGQLLPIGMQHAYELQIRLRNNFNVLKFPYTENQYNTLSSMVSRSQRTGISFLYSNSFNEGPLEDGFQPTYLPTNTENEDYEMRFFDNCPNYQDIVNSDATLKQYTEFNMAQLPLLADKIYQKIGSNGDWITVTDVQSFWNACVFQIATSGGNSSYSNPNNAYNNFCSLFDEYDAGVMQYSEDLKEWWQKSYANPLNYNISCYLLSQMVNGVVGITKNQNDSINILKFGHYETVIPLLSLLGLFKDSQPLMANSSEEFIQNRKFQSRLMGTFLVNVVWTVYKCSSSNGFQYKVRMLVNEKEQYFPNCTSLFCPLDQIVDNYQPFLGETCGYCNMCFNSTSEWPPYAQEIGLCPNISSTGRRKRYASMVE